MSHARLSSTALAVGCASLLLLSGCHQRTGGGEGEVKALMDTSRAWSKTVATGNVDAIMKYWTDDAVLMMPGEPVRTGQSEIRAYVEAALKTPGFSISWEPLKAAVSRSGDIGYLIERNRVTFPDGHGRIAHQVSEGVTVWRKQSDGSWKNAVDISTPAADTALHQAARGK